MRTRLRKTGKFRGSDEGGKPFGFFTGATGITIYRGDAWPEDYRGNLIVGDVANNLVYRARLANEGMRLVARRADEGRSYFSANGGNRLGEELVVDGEAGPATVKAIRLRTGDKRGVRDATARQRVCRRYGASRSAAQVRPACRPRATSLATFRLSRRVS